MKTLLKRSTHQGMTLIELVVALAVIFAVLLANVTIASR
jgi:prepilin-type N-terminal cleavage/methylation domain-containing protein